MFQSSRFILPTRKINFKNISPRKTLIIIFSQKNYFLNFLETFQPMSMGCSKYQGTNNSRLMNTSSVIYYSQENPPHPDFDLPQTKRPFELSNLMTNLNQFTEISCQNPNNFQTSNLPCLQKIKF